LTKILPLVKTLIYTNGSLIVDDDSLTEGRSYMRSTEAVRWEEER